MTADTRGAFVLRGADVRWLVWHMALYGLASILDDAGVPGLRLEWSREVQAKPAVTGDPLDSAVVADAVLGHAAKQAAEGSWIRRDIVLKGAERGLMSPRLTSIGGDTDAWSELQQARHEVIDSLLDGNDLLAVRLVGALGQPAYWSRNRKGDLLQDDGASRLEMQPRNQGSEIVRNRLRPLAESVARRTAEAVLTGLDGGSRRDEIGKDSPSSRTATGFAAPGPTDNAVAWCALWGMSCFPVAPRVNLTRGAAAVTPAHVRSKLVEWFFVPVWDQPWTLARTRTVLMSRALVTAGSARLGDAAVSGHDRIAAEAWLRDRGVRGLVGFRIHRFGSASAPERRALRGEPFSLA